MVILAGVAVMGIGYLFADVKNNYTDGGKVAGGAVTTVIALLAAASLIYLVSEAVA